MSVYTEYGYENRDEYLERVAEVFEVPLDTVLMHAELLGPDEDFDGLIIAVSDLGLEI